jgi:putative ABC transport system ATP-binding protein
MKSMFTFRNVVFKDIIHYPDIDIPEYKATFICGESGCGKSTLLKLMNGTVSPNSGVIEYDGKSTDEYEPAALRREVLLCGQSAFLFDESIYENFVEFHKYRDSSPPDEREIEGLLKICGIHLPLDSNCTTMSGGERQRVFTAVCLSFRPRVLLLDEPTSALDDAIANTLLFNVKEFCKEHEITMVIVSHNRCLAEVYADYGILL